MTTHREPFAAKAEREGRIKQVLRDEIGGVVVDIQQEGLEYPILLSDLGDAKRSGRSTPARHSPRYRDPTSGSPG